MIVSLALAIQALVPPAPPPPPLPRVITPQPLTLPPQDWTNLPTLRLVRASPDRPALSDFVRDEVRSGRCNAQTQSATGFSVIVTVALLVTPQGLVRRTLPRAIGCPSVEQYAAGLAFSRAMGNTDVGDMNVDGWYKTSMVFTWRA